MPASSRLSVAILFLFTILFVSSGLSACVPSDQPAPTVPVPRFVAAMIDSIQIGYGLAIGHVDDDGRPDILLADKKQFVWYQNGSWERHVMVDDLTSRDNVAIAAEDIDGDGQVEVAVGAMWNPGETSNVERSGSVHYLLRPDDPTQPWEPVSLYHEPTVHRMHWVPGESGRYDLVMLPLHGIGNQGGEGAGVNIIAYTMPDDPRAPWPTKVLDNQMHLTHNFEVVRQGNTTQLLIAGKEGIRRIPYPENTVGSAHVIPGVTNAAGEVRLGDLAGTPLMATIEPMHGTHLVAYIGETEKNVIVLDSTFAQGHALAVGDLLGIGRDQVVAGWRNPNDANKVGIKLYVPDETGEVWNSYIIDDNQMACEDLKLADLDGDGRLDIIAAGRASNNLIIYWNRT